MSDTQRVVQQRLAGLGCSQDWLARQVGIHPTALSRILRGFRREPTGFRRRVEATLTLAEEAEAAAEAARRRVFSRGAASVIQATESQIPDAVAAARAAFARVVDATSPAEREAAATEALHIGTQLDPDSGQVACPAALCAALGVPRFVYDDVVRRYAGKAPTHPRPGSRPARLLAALQHAGDRRFTPEAA